VTGYRSGGGVLDQMLVGPLGVMAIEIKYINGVVHCDDHGRWSRDKYDRYGNLVESDLPIADRGGRSPSDQVNAVADRLQRFLASRDVGITIARAVVLSHPTSRLGHVGKPRLNLLTTCDQLTPTVLTGCMTPLPDGIDMTKVLDLVKRDHRYHAKRKAQRRPGKVHREHSPAGDRTRHPPRHA